ncbi:hypothetical protein EUTSA_v10010433mg [Eutrema salsugineum]|uniref:Uncharacterized protein n=1 Tax=Eutrema salsugineum TaxID=72664 RepID=V4LZH3_EUTSA|nr:hypothetical protein EUTSA_v10010433mg [Eutrema salsugineum]
MGKWNNRSRFNRRRSPSRWYSDRHSSSSSGYGEDDGIPVWEKRFCEVIGSVPWQKVVEASDFKSWYQETFNNEKKRFWSQLNGLHCDISLPDPDLYISEVDWDDFIDPELIWDLESAYFAPPDEDKIGLKRGRREKSWSGCNLVPIEETRMLNIPWEGSVSGKKTNGWNVSESSTDHPKDSARHWEAKPSFGNEKENDTTSVDCLRTEERREIQWKTKDNGDERWENSGHGNEGWDKSGHQNKKAKGFESVPAEEYEMHDNPWEAKPSCRKETAEDTTWGGCSGQVWEDRGWGSGGKWRNRDLGNEVMEMKEWPSTRYSQDYREPKSYNPWRAGSVPDNTTRRDYGANAGGWQTRKASETNRRNWDVNQSSDGWETPRPIRDGNQNRKVNFSSK